LRLVLDASVAAKWFSNEDLTDRAVSVRDAFLDGRIGLCAPQHILYEVGNSVWKNKSLGLDDSIKAVESLLAMEIELIMLDSEAAGQSMRLARDIGVTYYDAVYAQISAMRKIPLLTADRRLFEAARNTVHLKDYTV
jgi:predicted nucleic acid-binding protein